MFFPQLQPQGWFSQVPHRAGKEGSHSGARSGGLAQLPAQPPRLLPADRPRRGDPPTSTGRAQTQKDLSPHLLWLHLLRSSPHPTSQPSGFAKAKTGRTKAASHPERSLASGDCLTESFLPLQEPAGRAKPPPATAGVGGDHKLSLLRADASHPQGKAPKDPREASHLTLPALGLGGQLCQLKSHLCFNSSPAQPELAPNPLPLSPAGTRNRPLLGNH